jgi:hypothetical protein
MPHVDSQALSQFTQQLMQAKGMSASDAAVVATSLQWADDRGIASHGVAFLPRYVQMIDEGDLDVRARPERVNATPAIVDAHQAAGAVAMAFAMQEALREVEHLGTVNLWVRRLTHAGAMGQFVQTAAEQGCMALLFAAGPPLMAYHGAANAITSKPTSMTASLDNASLVGSLQTATGRESYKLDVANSTLYNTRAQLTDFAKTWSSSSMNDSGRAYQWTFTSAGALTGSSVTTGCEYTGQLSLRSEGKAIVNVEVVETCPGQTTSLTYRGIAFTKNGQAVFTLASDKGAALFKFPAPQ